MFGILKRAKPELRAFPNPESSRIAAVDLWITANIAPSEWPIDKTHRVIRELRSGKSSRVVSRETGIPRDDVAKIARYVNVTGTLAELISSESGVAAVEAAIVLPVLAFLILGGLTLGMAVQLNNSLTFAVEGAARCRAMRTCVDDAAAIAYAVERAGVGEFTSAMEPCGASVRGSYTFQLINLFPAIPLSVSACYPADNSAPVRVAQLPACGPDNDGVAKVVSDANAPAFGAMLSGGGNQVAQAVCDGRANAWTAH